MTAYLLAPLAWLKRLELYFRYNASGHDVTEEGTDALAGMLASRTPKALG